MIYGDQSTLYTDQVARDPTLLSNAEIDELQDEHNVNLENIEVEDSPACESYYFEHGDQFRIWL